MNKFYFVIVGALSYVVYSKVVQPKLALHVARSGLENLMVNKCQADADCFANVRLIAQTCFTEEGFRSALRDPASADDMKKQAASCTSRMAKEFCRSHADSKVCQ